MSKYPNIIEAMSRVEPPWKELHHRSYFLPELDRLECEDYRGILSERIVGEVALRSYQERSQLQLTHIDRDKGGHEARVLEASRIFSFFIFTKGTAFVPL